MSTFCSPGKLYHLDKFLLYSSAQQDYDMTFNQDKVLIIILANFRKVPESGCIFWSILEAVNIKYTKVSEGTLHEKSNSELLPPLDLKSGIRSASLRLGNNQHRRSRPQAMQSVGCPK